MELFDQWFVQAKADTNTVDTEAFVLSTIDTEKHSPSSRVVLLKFYDKKQFIFFTNYHSVKAKHIANNPHVALNFYWSALEKQIHVVGTATKTPHKINLNYFRTRPYQSQINAWASPQSSPIDNPKTVIDKALFFQKKFPEKVPLPEHWGGFSIIPQQMEFWQGRNNRFHDRLAYFSQNNHWHCKWLAP